MDCFKTTTKASTNEGWTKSVSMAFEKHVNFFLKSLARISVNFFAILSAFLGSCYQVYDVTCVLT